MTGLIGKYGNNYKSLLKLAIPIIVGQLGGIITGLADTIMVGQHSTEELAAASFVNNVLNAFIIFGTGFSFVTNFLIAIPAGYLLGFPFGMGIRGIWLAYPIGFVFSVALLGIRARKLMR